MSTSSWHPAFPLSDLAPGTARVVKQGRTQVAVFRLEDGRVRAVDNRCPHEGYPLSSGYVRGETLTCAWHNFKFDVCSGACLQGDEAVQVWPVRVVDGQVEVDLSPPDRTAAVQRAWSSLEAGLQDRKAGSVARDVARLLEAGVRPIEIALYGAEFDALRGEYGPSHALPVAYDILPWTRTGEPLDAVLPLTQALDVATEAQVRRPLRPRPAPASPPADPASALRAAVEAEDAAQAEAWIRGALVGGVALETVEEWIYGPLADHFLDFGHALIYQGKLFDLLREAGASPVSAERIVGTHVYGIVTGTREDTLPPWSGCRRRLATVDVDELEARPRPGHMELDALVGLDAGPSMERVMASDAPLDEILAALSEAASGHLLDFDVTIDGRVDVQNGWLDVTHRLTFVNAVRSASKRWRSAERWKLVLQAAWFVGKATPLDGPRPEPVRVLDPSPAALSAAILGRRPAEALGITGALLSAGRAEEVRAVAMEVCMADVLTRGVVVAHLVKSTVAVFEEHGWTGSSTPVLALVRWFASPVAERRTARVAHEAVRLIRDGKPPEKLAD